MHTSILHTSSTLELLVRARCLSWHFAPCTASLFIACTPDSPLVTHMHRLPQFRAFTEKVRELQSTHAARVRAVLEHYGQLRKAVAQYNVRLQEAMAAAAPGAGVEVLTARMGDTLSLRDQA